MVSVGRPKVSPRGGPVIASPDDAIAAGSLPNASS
ncbi:Uncharacterised protein [Mycobacteroides abscessus subsp. abscessus]|nr:Uncharacterised protein [Mycobacteroides abscessus subsp. abscessus]